MALVQTEPKKIYLWTNEVKWVFYWENKVRPSWPDKDYLCFTAEQANSKIALFENWSPTSVSLETSTNWTTWSNYTSGTYITLTNIGDKLYWRNKSETVTNFSIWSSAYYQFSISGSIGASGDINFLLCKNSTDTIPNTYCFYGLFTATALTTIPKLLATTLKSSCYRNMFQNCSSLTELPKLPATTLATYCYYQMFSWCSKIKLSKSKTLSYQKSYRIPRTWTWTTASNALGSMFSSTWWSFTWTPLINTTYYTSNTVV